MQKNSDYTHGLARKGTPNLYLAASFFEPDEKFKAFLATYAAMRLIDDIVDNSRASGILTDAKRDEIHSHLDNFAAMIRQGSIDSAFPYAGELESAWKRFQIPGRPFIRLVESMKFDLDNDRFDTLDEFLAYSEGAAVAPGSIFMHLAGCSFDSGNRLVPPDFDIHETARPLAVFSYLVHIIRDFKKDFISGQKPLVYIDTETLNSFHIGENDLAEIAVSGKQTLKFTKMIQWYYNRATEYQQQCLKMLAPIGDKLPPDGLLALNFVYELYTRTRDKISEIDYQIAAAGVSLAEADIFECARLAALRSGADAKKVTARISEILAEGPA